MYRFKTDQQIIREQLIAMEIIANQMTESDLTHSEKRGLSKVLENLSRNTLVRIDAMDYKPKQDITDIEF